ncbi:glycogen synthase [bacterium]|nr:glycogen synthase [bacterium]
MNILFVSAEVAPFSKAGGLADVAGSLPGALTPYAESVGIISPLYGHINKKQFDIIATEVSGEVALGMEHIPYTMFMAEHPNGSIPVWFVSNDRFFARNGIYTKADGEGFKDNIQRYFFFQLVVLDLLNKRVFDVDILHCNDHHTGLLPSMTKSLDMKIKSIFTIHNFLYHGHFSKEDSKLLPDVFSGSYTLTQWDNYSSLLEGIDNADRVNTVSPGYARELLAGDNVDANSLIRLRYAEHKFSGIVNGIDTKYWDPENDQYTPHHFSAESLEGKLKNKIELLTSMGLDTDVKAPVLGLISRLVENKGFPLIVKLLDEFVKRGVKFVFLGSGDPIIAAQLRKACVKHPRKIAFDDGFNEPLAHLIEAGSDMFLMPSRFEPCGLNQLYSLRYGTIPIVNNTGGLGDTVENWQPGSGTGFVFDSYDLNSLRAAMKRAIDTFRLKEEWTDLIKRGMSKDFSWDQSAKQYLNLYEI